MQTERKLYIEAEVHDVAIGNNILLAFDSHFACFAYGCLAAEVHIVIVFDYFGTDKALFKVGVNYAGTAGSF